MSDAEEPITIKEIARKSGVSIGTVDRVLHNRGRVSRENAEKIRRIIEETGYVPNPHASTLSNRRHYRIAILLPDTNQEFGFWKGPVSGADKAFSELKSYRFTGDYFFYNRYRDSDFESEGGKVLENLDRYDALLMAPVLTGPAAEFLMKLPEDFPVVLIDSPVPGARPCTCIGHDSFKSGQLAARLLGRLLDGAGPVALLKCSDKDFHIRERIRGFRSFFSEKAPSVQINEYLLDRPENLPEVLESVFKEGVSLSGIFVTDASAHAAVPVLQGRKKIPLIGFELTERNRRALGEGTIDFLINLRAEEQGYKGILALYDRLVMKKTGIETIMLPMDILAPENIDFF
jgi:LacI family transcriptional regulator